MAEISEATLLVSISGMPASLLAKIDRFAEQENRNRSNMIVVLLDEIIRQKRQKKAA